MLKIGIDVYSALHYPRGMGIYTINFLKYLAQIDKNNQYILYGNVEDVNNVLPKQDNFRYRNLGVNYLICYEQFALPKACKEDDIDILHSPANTSPFFLDKKIKRILTLHDVMCLKKEVPFPKHKRQFFGRFYYAFTTVLNAPRAEKILTVSNYSKEDISKTLKINKEKIILTFNGHEHFDISNATSIEELQKKYQIPTDYYFHLGGEAPTKNTEFLLKYFVKHQDKNIVIAGIRNLEISHLYANYNKYNNIKFIPYIPQEDIVGLYMNAKAFLFASLYEGFGIPLLEAMKCSCPIISSNATCLPEVAGDAALYFYPHDINTFSEQIQILEKDDNLRQKLLKKGQERHNIFCWQNSAKIIHEVYAEICKE